jgi:hypothetical protein
MDYEKFRKEYDQYMEWGTPKDLFKLDSAFMSNPLPGAASNDVISFSDYKTSDAVNSPAHYTRGSQEAIDTIEEAIQDAPSVEAGMLQGQVLKYLLRLWLKSDSLEDAKKARWYLNRLISKLES